MHAIHDPIHRGKADAHIIHAVKIGFDGIALRGGFSVHDQLEFCALGVEVREQPVEVPNEGGQESGFEGCGRSEEGREGDGVGVGIRFGKGGFIDFPAREKRERRGCGGRGGDCCCGLPLLGAAAASSRGGERWRDIAALLRGRSSRWSRRWD